MNRPAVEQVPAPFQQLAIGRELKTRQVLNRTSRSVLARNPFGIVKRERPRTCRNSEMRMEDFAGSFGCI